MRITYEPFKEIVAKDYIKFKKLNDLIYAFAQLRAVGQPVARALKMAEDRVLRRWFVKKIRKKIIQLLG